MKYFVVTGNEHMFAEVFELIQYIPGLLEFPDDMVIGKLPDSSETFQSYMLYVRDIRVFDSYAEAEKLAKIYRLLS